MGSVARFLLLAGIKLVTRLVYRYRVRWVGEGPDEPWGEYRLVAVLNHTSLFEWLYAGGIPFRFLWQIASRGLVPAADKTLQRPVIGRFFKLLAPQVVSISRQADHSWQAVLDRVDSDSMLIIFPEGRMKRPDGLDKHGQPMTVRGGIADILRAMPEGRMLIAYSGGLHHVQMPGQLFPRLFRTLSMSLEEVTIPAYKAAMGGTEDPQEFKASVKRDLEARRDRYCPVGREVWLS